MSAPGARTSGPARREPGWQESWGAALQAVEVGVAEAEELLRRVREVEPTADEPPVELTDWVAPSLQGPVPLEFADRARRLLQRHLDVSERLAEAMAQLRSQRRVMSKIDQAEVRPVYYDKAL